MKSFKLVQWVILCLLIALVLIYLRFPFISKSNPPPRYCRLQDADLMVSSNITLNLFQSALEKHGGYVFTDQPNDATMIFFNLLVDYSTLYHTINTMERCAFVHGILTIDLFASKSRMFKHLRENLSAQILNRVIPRTYLLSKEELPILQREYSPLNLYILKKNVQRQKGVVITRDLPKISASENEGYVVCQELLRDNFLVDGRKINIRKYAIVVVNHKVRVYLYKDGFIYYAKKAFDSVSAEEDVHITTGYVDRSIYERNPLTLADLYERLGERNTHTLRENITGTLRMVFEAYRSVLQEIETENSSKTKFVILGCDMAVKSDLRVSLMEINKGPDMGAKDTRDGALKQDLVIESLRACGAIPGSPNLIRIL